jgi:hypothetical protein
LIADVNVLLRLRMTRSVIEANGSGKDASSQMSTCRDWQRRRDEPTMQLVRTRMLHRRCQRVGTCSGGAMSQRGTIGVDALL